MEITGPYSADISLFCIICCEMYKAIEENLNFGKC